MNELHKCIIKKLWHDFKELMYVITALGFMGIMACIVGTILTWVNDAIQSHITWFDGGALISCILMIIVILLLIGLILYYISQVIDYCKSRCPK